MSLINAILQRRLSMEEGGLDDSKINDEGGAVDDSSIPAAGEDDPAGAANADNGSPADDGGTEGTEGAEGAEGGAGEEGTEGDGAAGGDDTGDGENEPQDPPPSDEEDPEGGEGTEGEGEPSPDATVTDLPPTEDDLGAVDPEAVADQEAEEAEETIEDVEDDEAAVVAQADAVADLSQAKQSLEDLVEEIAQTLPDGGMAPEMVATAQGAANDILEEVGEPEIGLPSQESFETVVGRRANTQIAMEAIGESAKAIGSKIWELIVKMYDAVVEFLGVNSVRARAMLAAAQRAEKVKLETGNFPVSITLEGKTAQALRLAASQKAMGYKTFAANLVTQRQRSYQGYLMLMAMASVASTQGADTGKLDHELAEMQRIGKNNASFAMEPADANAQYALNVKSDEELRSLASAIAAAAAKFVENSAHVKQQSNAVKSAISKLAKGDASKEAAEKMNHAIKLASSELKRTFSGLVAAWAAYRQAASAASKKAEE